MKKINLIWILALFLIMPAFAYSSSVWLNNWPSPKAGSFSSNDPFGICGITKEKSVLQTIEQTGAVTGTKAYIANYTGNTYIGDVGYCLTNNHGKNITCSNLTLAKNSKFCIVTYTGTMCTTSFTQDYVSSGVTFPYFNTNFNVTQEAKIDHTSCNWETRAGAEITNIRALRMANFSSGTPPVTGNLSIFAKNKFYGDRILKFNVTLKNATKTFNYTTLNGRINTTIKSTQAKPKVNITLIAAGGYYTKFESYNASLGNYNSSVFPTRFKFNITANISSTTIQNFTITLTSKNSTDVLVYNTTHYSLIARPLVNQTYYMLMDAPGYAFENNTKAALVNYSWARFKLYLTNQFFFWIKNEQTLASLNGTNVTIDLISNAYARTYTTKSGNKSISLLIPETYSIRYYATNYYTRLMPFVLTNRSYNNITLYLMSNSTGKEIIVFIYDQTGSALEGAYVKMKKYSTISNSYNLVETGYTNFEGKTLVHPLINTEYYKFTIEYNGVVVKETTPTYIYDTNNIVIYVVVGSDVMKNYFISQGTSHLLDFNNVTKNFRFTYNDASNSLYGGCLKVMRTFGVQTTLVNNTCVNSPSSTILLHVPGTNNTLYTAYGYIAGNSASDLTLVETLTIDDYMAGKLNAPIMLFLTICLTIVFALIARWDIRISAIMTPIPIFLTSMLGLIDINRGIATGFLALGFIIAFIVKK